MKNVNIINAYDSIPVPETLDGMIPVVQSRVKKRKAVRNYTMMPIGAIAASVILFIFTVNMSPTIAHAMEDIPILGRFTRAVILSPSLTVAAEQNLVQAVGLEQIVGDVTVRVEYVIVDDVFVHIFYSFDREVGFSVTLLDADNVYNSATFVGVTHVGVGQNEIRHFIAGFERCYGVPNRVIWSSDLWNWINDELCDVEIHCLSNREVFGSFEFIIDLDSDVLHQGEEIYVGYGFEVDGQHFTLETVTLNPIHTRVMFSANENNTAVLRGLNFYMVNETGVRFNQPTIELAELRNLPSRIVEGMIDKHFLDTAFFSNSKSLYIIIEEEVALLDKDMITPDREHTRMVTLDTPIRIRIK